MNTHAKLGAAFMVAAASFSLTTQANADVIGVTVCPDKKTITLQMGGEGVVEGDEVLDFLAVNAGQREEKNPDQRTVKMNVLNPATNITVQWRHKGTDQPNRTRLFSPKNISCG